MKFSEKKKANIWSSSTRYQGRKKKYIAEVIFNEGKFYFLIETPDDRRFNSLWDKEKYGEYTSFEAVCKDAENWIDVDLRSKVKTDK